MAALKKNLLVKNWPFNHTEIGLNGDTGFIKLIAIVTMFIDHLGVAVFPGVPILRIIGRIAFPIFAYCIAAGCVYTRNIGKYLQRIVILALVVQPLYVVALDHTYSLMYSARLVEEPIKAVLSFYMYSWKDPSILVTLAAGVASIWALKERKIFITALILILAWVQGGFLDYGVRGVLLMLLMYAFINRWYISLPVVAAFMIYWGMDGARYTLFGMSFGTQIFALLALPFIYIPMRTGIKPHKWLFYIFYPAHLLLLLIIQNYENIIAFIKGL